MLQGVSGCNGAHHDCLALVLKDVAGPADLVAASQAQEHQLVSRVYGLHVLWLHGRMLPLGRHIDVSVWLLLDQKRSRSTGERGA